MLERGVGHFHPKFKGKRASPTNDFRQQKIRVSGLSYGEKMPKISTAWVGCTNVTDRETTDRQTDGSAIAYRLSERNVVDVG